MTRKAKTAVMWAITCPMAGEKSALLDQAFKFRPDAITWLTGWHPDAKWDRGREWQKCRRMGYRCVKVRVTET